MSRHEWSVTSLKMHMEDRRQRCRVEGLELTSSHEHTKITTNGWTTINKKDWNLPKKVFYIQRQRRNHNETVRGVHLWYNKKCIWILHSSPWYLHVCFKLKILLSKIFVYIFQCPTSFLSKICPKKIHQAFEAVCSVWGALAQGK